MHTIRHSWFLGLLMGMVVIVACGQATSSPIVSETTRPGETTALPSQTPALTPALPAATLASAATASRTQEANSLPADPQEIQFETDDGQILNGRYYPAAISPAPLVVLMHWAPGDQNEWNAIAAWLQNRGLARGSSGDQPWLDSSWFPPMLEGQSFAVFTYNFRNCEGGCKSFTRAAWLMDARAAMMKARELEGVDPHRIVAIGASIGADGAPDGCNWVNTQFPNTCLGALSLSPGGYLTIPYRKIVSTLGAEQPPKPAWCLYADGDGESKRACEDASGDNYKSVKYIGSDHGMELIEPDVDPSALQIILDFLKSLFAI